jgi:hypothetical protein
MDWLQSKDYQKIDNQRKTLVKFSWIFIILIGDRKKGEGLRNIQNTGGWNYSALASRQVGWGYMS